MFYTLDVPFVRIRTTKNADGGARTIYLHVMSVSSNGNYLGCSIDKNTLDEKKCYYDKDGVFHETLEFIHHTAISKVTPLYEDLKYGNLTTMTFEEQKKKYKLK